MQINRLFEIIYLLTDHKTMTASALAERFEVSTRTIYRDVETLSAAGIPIYMHKGKGGGISLLDHFILDKAVLTEEEKSDLITSLKAIDRLHLLKSDTALHKVGSLLGETQTDWIEIDFTSWNNSGKETVLFELLKKAIINRQAVSFTYANSKGEQQERTVEPLKLYFRGMSHYLYAYCTLRGDYRYFKLNRIKNIQPLENFFERSIPQDAFKAPQTKQQKKQVHLVLKIAPAMAFRVYDEFNEYEACEDGSFLVQLTCPEGSWLYSYILSFGKNCVVVEPDSLREYIKNELKKSYEQYLVI